MATILVVDDDGAVLKLAATMLEKAGHNVMTASNGLEALVVYQSYARQLDLVLTDVQMPGMSGLELVARIRATHNSARVLVMSSCLPEGFEHRLASDTFVRKPFLAEQLLGAVQTALSGHL